MPAQAAPDERGPVMTAKQSGALTGCLAYVGLVYWQFGIPGVVFCMAVPVFMYLLGRWLDHRGILYDHCRVCGGDRSNVEFHPGKKPCDRQPRKPGTA